MALWLPRSPALPSWFPTCGLGQGGIKAGTPRLCHQNQGCAASPSSPATQHLGSGSPQPGARHCAVGMRRRQSPVPLAVGCRGMAGEGGGSIAQFAVTYGTWGEDQPPSLALCLWPVWVPEASRPQSWWVCAPTREHPAFGHQLVSLLEQLDTSFRDAGSAAPLHFRGNLWCSHLCLYSVFNERKCSPCCLQPALILTTHSVC